MDDLDKTISIMGFNIWFDSYMQRERLISLIKYIIKNKPDIICLQEVLPEIYKILINKLGRIYPYNFPNSITYTYGCVIFSKHKITKCLQIPFKNSNMGRSAVIAKIEFPMIVYKGITIEKIDLAIITSHFESVYKTNESNNPINKISQFTITESIMDEMYDEYSNVIFCGDTNVSKEDEQHFIKTDTTHFPDNPAANKWKDAWIYMGDEENKYTFDSRSNKYLKMKNYNYCSRLDRILYKCDDMELVDFKLIKEEEGEDEISDHYGTLTKFLLSTIDDI